jgi:hypothetical protein
MLPLLDTQVRFMLLSYLAVRAGQGATAELRRAGIKGDQVARLRELSALDLVTLAEMRHLPIGVAFDLAALEAELRAVTLVTDAKAREAYFIRHGASRRMMRALFKLSRRVTYRRRRDCGAWRRSGRIRLPDPATREQIYRVWVAVKDRDPRLRYYQLHQAFPEISTATLELVVTTFEESR